mgnify:CR=1 FL=1
MTILIKILQFVMSLSILVIIHELGHFVLAKFFKTRVEKFYLFFDPWFSLFKFKKGETERILAYQYYKSSYDACCHLIKDKDVSNESLKKNYEMMWNFVKGYSNKDDTTETKMNK